MATDRFDRAFQAYLAQILQAREERRHHDHRRQLFTSFIHDAFDVEADELQLEEHVTALRVRGFIDLLYQYLVFEFKRNLDEERDDGMRELTTYLTAVAYRRPVGVLTDGIRFEVYSLEDGELKLVDEENLEAPGNNVVAAYLWFEAYLFSARDVEPTPQDIVRRFGSKSIVFVSSRQALRGMFRSAHSDPAVQVKYSEWDRLLAKVYGEAVGAEELFVKHTYLALLTRVIAYVATTRHRPRDADLLAVVDGRAFQRLATNLVEADFFAWVLSDGVRSEASGLLQALVAHLGQYDLTRLGEMDLLQRLYQDLVDPADRHVLGEYYTPDWLAELTLRESGYGVGKSLLDPACGSGTFLFTAIRLLSQGDLSPHQVTDWCLANVVGVDVHPIAVLTSKVNYVLALQRFGGLATYSGPISIPVYLADSLVTSDPRTGLAPIPVSEEESFHITEDMVLNPSFDDAIDTLTQYAARLEADEENMNRGFAAWLDAQGLAEHATFWGSNIRLMRRLIREGRDSIWSFILKNAYRPFYLAQRRFDFVAGNPPWLSYRFIRDVGYRGEVRRLTFAYGLLAPTDQRLFAQLELATLFLMHSRARYLAPDGTIAFVMPRSVVTGARQHARFRAMRPFARVLDLQHIDVPSERSLKVFGVDSCVLICHDQECAEETTGTRYSGTLPAKGLAYDDAVPRLTTEEFVYQAPQEAEPSEYLPRVLQGATIVPRGLWFVAPASTGVSPVRPRLMTDPSIQERAQEPWQNLHVEANVEAVFIYATLLSNDLLPFGYRRLSTVLLPLHRPSHLARSVVMDAHSAFNFGFPGMGAWLEQAERVWVQRGTSEGMSLSERLDYQATLTGQDPLAPFRVLYNRAGSHVCSCAVEVPRCLSATGDLRVQGFVVDSGAYWIGCASLDECHYLCAALNSPCVDEAITAHQTRGAFHGPRDIHRRPFEVLPTPIPPYDSASAAHQSLVALAQECEALVSAGDMPVQGEIGRVRQRVRGILGPQIAQIDALVSAMLNLGG